MQGGYIGDHWEDGCQVQKNEILILFICAILLRSGSSHKDPIKPGFCEVTVFLSRWIAILLKLIMI